MLLVEEYITRRKKEDRLNEFDMNQRAENLKTCVNYVFEYFNNYLDITEADEKTALHEEKLEKYRHQLQDYASDVQEWLVRIYGDYGKHMNRNIANILKQDEFFESAHRLQGENKAPPRLEGLFAHSLRKQENRPLCICALHKRTVPLCGEPSPCALCI